MMEQQGRSTRQAGSGALGAPKQNRVGSVLLNKQGDDCEEKNFI